MSWDKKRYENYKRLIRYDYSMGYINGIHGLQNMYLTFISFDEFECAKVVDEFCKEMGVDVRKATRPEAGVRQVGYV